MLVVVSALLMELLTCHLRSLAMKRRAKAVAAAAGVERAEPTATTFADSMDRSVLDFHQQKGAVGFYILSIALRIVVEA